VYASSHRFAETAPAARHADVGHMPTSSPSNDRRAASTIAAASAARSSRSRAAEAASAERA